MDQKELMRFGIAVLRAIGCDEETAKEVASSEPKRKTFKNTNIQKGVRAPGGVEPPIGRLSRSNPTQSVH